MKSRHIAVALLTAGLVAGCSSGGGTGPSVGLAEFIPGVYVGTDFNSVTMINVTKDGTGQYQGALNTTEQGMYPASVAITVIVSGNQITINMSSSLGSRSSLTGTIRGRELHLQAPQKDGTIEDYVLRPGTVAQYNSDVEMYRP